MWTVIKIDKKKIELLKKDFQNKVGDSCKFYSPKILVHKFSKNKLCKKEFSLLGDYVFCYHENFVKKEFINMLKFSRGLKYFLTGFTEFQKDISNFISFCEKLEDDKGFITQSLFDLKINSNYKFLSGPFVEKIFKIVTLLKNNINILIDNINTSIKPKQYLFRPI